MRYFVLALLLLVPIVAYGADGDAVGEQHRSVNLLCDGKAAADEGNDCSTYQVNSPITEAIYSVTSSTGCSAYSVAVQEHHTSAGAKHLRATLASTGNSSYHLFGSPMKYITVTLTTLTDCTDLDVTIEQIVRR